MIMCSIDRVMVGSLQILELNTIHICVNIYQVWTLIIRNKHKQMINTFPDYSCFTLVSRFSCRQDQKIPRDKPQYSLPY